MDARQNTLALLKRRGFERYGSFEHWWPETLSQAWPSQGYPLGADPEAYFGYDLADCGGWFDNGGYPGEPVTVEETDAWRVAKDSRLATLKYWKGKSGTPEHIGFEITGPEKWKDYRERLMGTDASRLDIAGSKAALAAARASGRFSVYNQLFVFELLRGTAGDEHFLPALLEEPEWIRDFCQVYLDFYKRHFDLLFSQAGLPDGIFIFEDMGYRNGPFCSPATLKELILPYHKELVGFFKSYGLPVILHSCGDVRRLMPSIIEAGWDCIQPMEAKAGVDVRELARDYGKKIAFMGNIDVQILESGDKERIRIEVEGKVKALKELKAAYFFHSDHSIPPNVSLESYRFALDTFRKLA